MNVVSTILRSFAALRSHCEAQLKGRSRPTQLGSAASPKQSFCSEFAVKGFSNDCKDSSQLTSEGRLLRRSASSNLLKTLLSGDSLCHAPRNDEARNMQRPILNDKENDRKVFGGVKENLLEGSLL